MRRWAKRVGWGLALVAATLGFVYVVAIVLSLSFTWGSE